jgi:hypothetical protein
MNTSIDYYLLLWYFIEQKCYQNPNVIFSVRNDWEIHMDRLLKEQRHIKGIIRLKMTMKCKEADTLTY